MNPDQSLVIVDPAAVCSVAFSIALLASMFRYLLPAIRHPAHITFHNNGHVKLGLCHGIVSGSLDCLAILFMYQGIKSLCVLSMGWSTYFGASLIGFYVLIPYFISSNPTDETFAEKRKEIEWRYPARWVIASSVPLLYLFVAWATKTTVGPKWPYFAGLILSIADWIIHPLTQRLWELKGVNISGRDDSEQCEQRDEPLY